MHDLSDPILVEWNNGHSEVSYVWDWGETRHGTYQRPDGEATSMIRYFLNFETMQTRNSDTNSTRKVKVVGVVRQ